MSTVTISKFRDRQFGGAVPFGNATILSFCMKTDEKGAVVNSNSTAPLVVGDKVVLGELPEGMRLDLFSAVVSTPMSAGVTGSLGFEYADGIDAPDAPQNVAHFREGVALDVVKRHGDLPKAPVVLPKRALLVLTIGGAANAKSSRIDVTVAGELTGAA